MPSKRRRKEKRLDIQAQITNKQEEYHSQYLKMVKILQRDLMVQDNMVKTKKENLLTMLFN